MRRLYSSFARGAPGLGLLLMRLAAGGLLFAAAAEGFSAGSPLSLMVVGVASLALGVLLLVGLWTPLAGVATAALVVASRATSGMSDPIVDALTALLGIALALLGPGGWSVDARLFGWKRLKLAGGDTNGEGGASDRGDSPPV